jgi:hypothetical protein
VGLLSWAVPAALRPGRGVYYPLWDYLYCTDAETCLHETAHRMDYRYLGHISDSAEFQNAVRVYIRVMWLHPAARDAFAERVCFFPGVGAPRYQGITHNPFSRSSWIGWGGYDELYAEMLVWANGQVDHLPACFQRFYDQALLNALLQDVTW